MSYYYNTVVSGDFETVIKNVTQLLKNEGFGVLTQIDIKKTLKDKLDVDFKKYTILGACNPGFAHQALQVENKIGAMLPCNVIVQELDENKIEVAAINPIISMQAVKNKQLENIADQVSNKLKNVIINLKDEN